jgi:carbonic anhydrase
MDAWDIRPLPADEALERLLEGNRRFVEDPSDARAKRWHADLAQAQQPFAVILGCSDSRAPAELVFDQGLGDLFMIRVAGNIVAPSLIGSAEYAVAQLGVKLAMVMGHTNCGAIAATVEAMRKPGSVSKNIEDITHRIQPQIERLLEEAGGVVGPETLRAAERANVLASVEQLQRGSPYLGKLARDADIRIVGAVFELETGRVRLV